MKVMLFANPKASKIKQMTDDIIEVNWQLVDINDDNTLEHEDYLFYVISPCEVADRQIPTCIPNLIDDSNKRPKQTLFCFLPDGDNFFFTQHQIKSLKAMGQMVEANGGTWLKNLPNTMAQWQAAILAGDNP